MTPHLNAPPKGINRRSVMCVACALAMGRVIPPLGSAPALVRASSVETLLQQATRAMTTLRSYHFELRYEQGQTVLVRKAKLHMKRARGDIERPDRLRATVEAKLGFLSVGVTVVSIQQRVWVDFKGITGELEIEPDVANVLLDPTALLLSVVSTIEEPRIVGTGELDGEPATHLAGIFDPRRMASDVVQSVFSEARPNPIDVWLDDRGRVRRVVQTGPLIASDSDDVIRRLDLSRYDEQFGIAPPD